MATHAEDSANILKYLQLFHSAVSCDHLSVPRQGRATTPQLTREGRCAWRPSLGSDARPAPPTASSSDDARHRHGPTPPRPTAASGAPGALWTRPAADAPGADAASDSSRSAAP